MSFGITSLSNSIRLPTSSREKRHAGEVAAGARQTLHEARLHGISADPNTIGMVVLVLRNG